jgi:hypothetical protein
MMATYRATFLLRGVVAVVCAGLFVGVLLLFRGPLLLGLLLIAAAVVLLELGILPWLVQRWALRWAPHRPTRASAPWFVDVEAGEKRLRDPGRQDVERNPSLW